MTHKYSDNEIESISSSIMRISDKHYFSIGFADKVSIDSYNDSVVVRGLIQKLEELFSEKERNIFYRYPMVNKLLIMFIVITLSNLIVYYLKLPPAIGLAVVLVMILSTFAIGLIITLPKKGKRTQKNIFYYRTRLESPSFWQRKKDEIIVGIVLLVIGGIGSTIGRILSGGYDTIKQFLK